MKLPAAVDKAAAEPETPDEAGAEKTQDEERVDEEKSTLSTLKTHYGSRSLLSLGSPLGIIHSAMPRNTSAFRGL